VDTGLGERILRFATTRENDGGGNRRIPAEKEHAAPTKPGEVDAGVLSDVGAEEYLPRVTQAVTPFRVVTSSAAMSGAHRLRATRWPERQSDDWRQGIPFATIQALVAYWRTAYDWRRLERRLNTIRNSEPRSTAWAFTSRTSVHPTSMRARTS
jgi:hypothetical protein